MSRPILPHEATLLPTQTGTPPVPQTGAGPSKDTSRWTGKRVQLVLGGLWDVDLEGSIDGTTWQTLSANVTAGATVVEVATFQRFMRVNVNTAVATLALYDVTIGGMDESAWT